MLDKRSAVLVRKLLHIVGNRNDFGLKTFFIVVYGRVHFYKVNYALEVVFSAYGELNRNGIALEPVLHHIKNIVEIRTHYVHLVDVNHSRYVVFISLTPNRLGLRLNTALGAKHRDGAVKHAQRTFNFNSEVNVAGSVDYIDAVPFPEACGSGGGNCDTSLLLLLHPVHSCGAVMRFAELMVDTRIEKNSLGSGSFTGIDMSHNTDISC